MVNENFGSVQHHQPSGKCSLKLLWDSSSPQSEWLRSRQQMTVNAGEDGKAWPLSLWVSLSASRVIMGNHLTRCIEDQKQNYLVTQLYHSGHLPRVLCILPYLNICVQCDSIHGSKETEPAYMSTSKQTDHENMVHIFNGVLISHKENWNCGIWSYQGWKSANKEGTGRPRRAGGESKEKSISKCFN